VTGFPAGAFAANCYLVAPAPGEECVIIDPGQDAERGIEELLDRYRLKPIAVLLTHGHIDHMWSVAPVCGAKGIPAYVHPDDRALLSDPGKALYLGGKQQFLGGMTFSEPDDVRALEDGEAIPLAGLDFTITIPRAIRRARSPSVAAPTTLTPSSPGTCCSPAPSAAPTCPAATTRPFSGRWPARSPCPTRRSSCPVTGRRRRSATSA